MCASGGRKMSEQNVHVGPILSVIVAMPGEKSEAHLSVLESFAAENITGHIEVIILAAKRAMVRLPAGALSSLHLLRGIEIAVKELEILQRSLRKYAAKSIALGR